MPVDNRTPKWQHQLRLVEREELEVEGVVSLGSYDENEMIMETEQGLLSIKGEHLNIKQLNLEQGSLVVEGLVKGISYDDGGHQKKGLLERFLK
ncbi:YabP/YqfC family sporulation protein [Propionispora vibrioides]|uniref:Sporulation protein YabP n=1 Tax=Propionispora vibrioides TaxID=112903 RepID=A0A1H8TMA9_9FIRM|nr:YabP/YqfC family sporulation protein [Propionispora vibrioides]SEO92200.1 sporulation protein YabP [Propionispora vibrioides]